MTLPAAESVGPGDLQERADRWIEIERRIADEKNQWRTEKDVLETSRSVLQQEQVMLQSKVEANELAVGLFETRLAQAQAELAEHEAVHQALMAGCDGLEQRLRALQPRLPEPLKGKIALQMERLGKRSADESASSVAERTQALVSTLAAIDQFNNTLTLTHQLRPGAEGEILDIRVLYWGLAAGYAIDEQGQRAWLLRPGTDGWQWQDAPEHAAAIKSLMDIYGKQKTPELILLPAGAQGGVR